LSKNAAPPLFAARMAAFYAGYLSVNGVHLPFFPVWLEYRGLTPTEIAICLSVPMFARVLSAPIGAHLADRAPNRRFAIVLLVGFGLFFWLFADLAAGFWPILIVTVLAFTFWGMALPAAEALMLTGVRQFGLDYGRVRLYGSASFIVANVGSGLLLTYFFGPGAIYWLLLGVLILSLIVSIMLPVTPRAIRARDDKERPEPVSARAILGHPVFVAVLVASGLIQASHSQLYNFGSIYWQSRGFSAGEIGLLWAVGTGAEIVLFAVAAFALRRVDAFRLIAIGGIVAILRWLLFGLEPGLAATFLLQMLHAFSFGATFLGVMKAITERVPDEITAAAQGLNIIATGGLMAVASLASGVLYESLGVHAFVVMTIPAAAGLVILAGWRPRRAASA
jgi:PPP family 3-phenylpropionic acid transporter